jgi:hypothetical protein
MIFESNKRKMDRRSRSLALSGLAAEGSAYPWHERCEDGSDSSDLNQNGENCVKAVKLEAESFEQVSRLCQCSNTLYWQTP